MVVCFRQRCWRTALSLAGRAMAYSMRAWTAVHVPDGWDGSKLHRGVASCGGSLQSLRLTQRVDATCLASSHAYTALPVLKGGGDAAVGRPESENYEDGVGCVALVPVAASAAHTSNCESRHDARLLEDRVLHFQLPSTTTTAASLRIRQIPGLGLGSCVWDASVALVGYLSEGFVSEFPQTLAGKRVLELGSGTGSTAIALAKFFGANISFRFKLVAAIHSAVLQYLETSSLSRTLS